MYASTVLMQSAWRNKSTSSLTLQELNYVTQLNEKALAVDRSAIKGDCNFMCGLGQLLRKSCMHSLYQQQLATE